MGVERPLRAPPSVDAILRSPVLEDAVKTYAHQPLVRLIRETVDSARRQTSSGGKSTGVDELALEVLRRITTEWTPAPRYVLNATGVLLHTNLGRARLSEEAIQALQRTSSYSDVELDLETGARGRRNSNLEAVLRALTGAEAATAVTNNAAAVLLCLTALARGKEVIVSRGQAVEIGGGFRIPAILAQSGSRLVEVGTTNRTRVDDYDSAITARSAAILHVHRSNFQIVGFTDEPSISELAALAHERDLLLIADNGSGALLDTARFGLRHEPTPIEAIADGADVVAFSGDKMLGGPQSGILAGTEAPIRRIERHPLARAMRLDKLILAALSATLQSYLRGSASTEIPFWRMVAQSNEYLRQRA
ncbi:MAG TPA: L-seryl-tRNA(Sec) selenium transferase, partial [Chloroflexota bacterium]